MYIGSGLSRQPARHAGAAEKRSNFGNHEKRKPQASGGGAKSGGWIKTTKKDI